MMLSELRAVGVLNADELRLKFTLNGRTTDGKTPGGATFFPVPEVPDQSSPRPIKKV